MGHTQREIADQIAEELGLTVRHGRQFLQRFLDIVADDLVKTKRIELRGLGIFAVHHRPERKTYHPQTGQPIVIPARQAIRYRSSQELRRRLNPPPPKPPKTDG